MTFLEVGRVIGYVLMWLVLVPVGVWLLARVILNAWKLAMWLVEGFCTLIAMGLCLVWAPIGWTLAAGEWAVKRVRARAV